jgi:hypothetical protein
MELPLRNRASLLHGRILRPAQLEDGHGAQDRGDEVAKLVGQHRHELASLCGLEGQRATITFNRLTVE